MMSLVIAAAARAMKEEKLRQQRLAKQAKEEEFLKAKKAIERMNRKTMTKEEKDALKEKKLLKLVGAVVVKCMSKYKDHMDHDLFKKHTKDLTQIITDKEKKSQSYVDGKFDALSDEKITKIKKFAKEYIVKLLRRLEKSGKGRSHPHPHSHSNGRGSGVDKRSRHFRDPRNGASTSTPRSDTASGSNTVVGVHDADEKRVDFDDDDDDDMLIDGQHRDDDFDIDDYDDDEDKHDDGASPMRGTTPSLSALTRTPTPLLASPSVTVTQSGKPKRCRWDERPTGVPLRHSLSVPDSLFDSL